MVTTATFVRSYLLGMGVLALLTGTVLDAPLHRHVMLPVMRMVERHATRPVVVPPAMRFLMDNTWARRLYHLLFAGVMFGLWWYLGTPAGAARLPHPR